MSKRRYALQDDQWDRIKDLFPGQEATFGVTAKDNGLFVEAVLYRYRARDAQKQILDLLIQAGIEVVIPPRANRKLKQIKDSRKIKCIP